MTATARQDFSRTLQTAKDAEGMARLLMRVADPAKRPSYNDVAALKALSGRYTDYAATLRAMVAEEDEAPAVADEQEVLL